MKLGIPTLDDYYDKKNMFVDCDFDNNYLTLNVDTNKHEVEYCFEYFEIGEKGHYFSLKEQNNCDPEIKKQWLRAFGI